MGSIQSKQKIPNAYVNYMGCFSLILKVRMFFFIYILLLYASMREHFLLNLGHVCNFLTFRIL